MMRFTFLFLVFLVFSNSVPAQSVKDAFKSTPYPLPRFVSLGASEVNARTGPGKQYPIRYVYQRKDLPVEIILEFEAWRKIRDRDGAESWVHQSMVSGKRTAIVEQDGYLFKKKSIESKIAADVQAGVILTVKSCDQIWCEASAGPYKGWIPQKNLWAIYPKEKFE